MSERTPERDHDSAIREAKLALALAESMTETIRRRERDRELADLLHQIRDAIPAALQREADAERRAMAQKASAGKTGGKIRRARLAQKLQSEGADPAEIAVAMPWPDGSHPDPKTVGRWLKMELPPE